MKRILALFLVLLISRDVLAAVGSGTVWWIQSTAPAGNTAGGGFDTGATMDNTLACTSATGGSPVCTSSNYTFVAGDATYWLYVQQGTNWKPGWYQIASVSGGAATLTATIGTALQFDTTKGSPYTHYQLNTAAGIGTTGSPTAGSWSIDYSKSDTALVSGVADLTIDGTVNTKVTSATRNFGVNNIGNMIHITAGTSWTFTTPFYEIVSVASNAATLDRSPSAAANANKATWYFGGAISFGSSTAGRSDTNVIAAAAAGNRLLIKSGSYTLAATSALASGTSVLPSIIEGYNTTPGDNPTGSNRPSFSIAAFTITLGLNDEIYNLILSGTGTSILTMSTSSKVVNVKATNSSTTAARAAFSGNVASSLLAFSEGVSYRGNALLRGGGAAVTYGNYLHDSNNGISDTGGSVSDYFLDNIIADNVTAAYVATSGVSQFYHFIGNTFYGAENALGNCISVPTSMLQPRLINNIFYGCATGITSVDTSQTGYSDFNDYFNNTADFSSASAWQYGPHDLTLNPTFANVGQYTGTNASISGSVLTDSGANFANTTDNVDFVYLSNGGAGSSTVGKYMITGHTSTTLTVDIAPGNSASGVAYQTTYGHNFAIGTNLKAQGFPGSFGGVTTSYLDMGAVQRQEAGGAAGTKGWTWTQ